MFVSQDILYAKELYFDGLDSSGLLPCSTRSQALCFTALSSTLKYFVLMHHQAICQGPRSSIYKNSCRYTSVLFFVFVLHLRPRLRNLNYVDSLIRLPERSRTKPLDQEIIEIEESSAEKPMPSV